MAATFDDHDLEGLKDTDEEKAEARQRNLLLAFWGTLGGGLLGVVLFSMSARPGPCRPFAVGLLVAAASAIVGALFGFLSGLPRSFDDVAPANTATAAPANADQDQRESQPNQAGGRPSRESPS